MPTNTNTNQHEQAEFELVAAEMDSYYSVQPGVQRAERAWDWWDSADSATHRYGSSAGKELKARPVQSRGGAGLDFFLSPLPDIVDSAAVPPAMAILRPAGPLLRKGALTQKLMGGARSKRRLVILCNPTSTADIQAVYDDISVTDNGKPLDQDASITGREKTVELLGHVAYAAVAGSPLLVVGQANRHFIHFHQVISIADENEIQQACTFAIITDKGDLRFSCDTSTDYQKWFNSLSHAFNVAHGITVVPPTPKAEPEAEEYQIEGAPLRRPRPTSRSVSRNRVSVRRSFSDLSLRGDGEGNEYSFDAQRQGYGEADHDEPRGRNLQRASTVGNLTKKLTSFFGAEAEEEPRPTARRSWTLNVLGGKNKRGSTATDDVDPVYRARTLSRGRTESQVSSRRSSAISHSSSIPVGEPIIDLHAEPEEEHHIPQSTPESPEVVPHEVQA
ncbi:hypothetical protein HK102_009086 [Quaeritorhiza haematococci]|nr:hypothetical protein HK102_009086 [Quaeritorhiza haematococci]